jgi:hypothetical protein
MRGTKLSMLNTQELSVKAYAYLVALGKRDRRIILKPGRMVLEPSPVRMSPLLYQALGILLKPERMLLKPRCTPAFSPLEQPLVLGQVCKPGKYIPQVFWDTR